MKIGLCGTMSVGKTTLVNALKELKQFNRKDELQFENKYQATENSSKEKISNNQKGFLSKVFDFFNYKPLDDFSAPKIKKRKMK